MLHPGFDGAALLCTKEEEQVSADSVHRPTLGLCHGYMSAQLQLLQCSAPVQNAAAVWTSLTLLLINSRGAQSLILKNKIKNKLYHYLYLDLNLKCV